MTQVAVVGCGIMGSGIADAVTGADIVVEAVPHDLEL